MATDNSLFPDVTERYERDPSAEDAAAQAIEADPPAAAPRPVAAAEPAAAGAGALLPDDFDHAPAWLAAPESAPDSGKQAPSGPRERKPLVLATVGAALVAIAGCATAVVLRGGTIESTEGTPRAAAAVATPSSSPSSVLAPPAPQPAPAEPTWCAESTVAGRSVGSGPGSTSDGPGVIRAFDHAYYAARDGGRVASLMVAPGPVPEIQRWIDDVPAGSRHCVTVTETPDPNVYAVELGLRMPGRPDGVIRQRVTVTPSPTGFKVAKVEDSQ
ncbi:hypothetical protein [Rhodococcus sp. SGAir0479]|uniref:hypothetical protein n=1 Tax=Rhodococcus sp. SGAir0479 TaxID=2567884 RepID=UPI0010CD4096|nr:hypothetical protein [Rhodococcus sp. SGAir0479]QCQ93663.1 hypothetical protein E7742_22225 [Rhodococcus sp. SGAir0479]